MSTEKSNEVEISKEEKSGVKASKMKKGRKSIAFLQEKKDNGEKIVQMCPVDRDKYFVMSAEMADCDICRLTTPGENTEMQMANATWRIRDIRAAAQIIHINFYMMTPTFCSKEKALEYGSMYMAEGADSLLPMGVNNETLKYMADNHLVVFGHVGALSRLADQQTWCHCWLLTPRSMLTSSSGPLRHTADGPTTFGPAYIPRTSTVSTWMRRNSINF
ncbi:MAG: 3-methyl-2-oxobutanoate hydroxymethyltransferase [Acetobacterium sp.]|nr:hypothetical protein [Bacillota bacterium]MCG2729374.1 3-methyl-2-oxobutanoate hydroxymethyltransferase [Acetobacterium sp.]